MKSRLRPTTASSRASLESRVLVYSAMAGAACLATPNAQATPQNITFSSAPASSSTRDVVVDFFPGPFANMQFVLKRESFASELQLYGGFAGRANIAQEPKSQAFHGLYFLPSYVPAHLAVIIGTHANGDFVGANRTGYVAFKQPANGHDYYGWLKVQVAADGKTAAFVPISGNIYGAYDLTSAALGDDFRVGSLGAVPEPANVATGLGLFALGAAGLREHRRRRKLVA